MGEREIRPSLSIWNYCKSNKVGGLTLDSIIVHIADVMGGYHISYTATEILKDLEFIDTKGKLTREAKRFLAGILHNRFFHERDGVVLIDPTKELNETKTT